MAGTQDPYSEQADTENRRDRSEQELQAISEDLRKPILLRLLLALHHDGLDFWLPALYQEGPEFWRELIPLARRGLPSATLHIFFGQLSSQAQNIFFQKSSFYPDQSIMCCDYFVVLRMCGAHKILF